LASLTDTQALVFNLYHLQLKTSIKRSTFWFITEVPFGDNYLYFGWVILQAIGRPFFRLLHERDLGGVPLISLSYCLYGNIWYSCALKLLELFS